MSAVRWPDESDVGVADLAARSDEVFASFLLQDSGCQAYGVRIGDGRWFAKGAVDPGAVLPLERAIDVHEAVHHPAIVPLRHVVRTPDGPVLVYPWVEGECLYPATIDGPGVGGRAHPGSAHARFRSLPVVDVVAAVDAVFDAHVAVTDAGFVAVDLYDGSFIYDFAARHVWLCDLDLYRPGPFVLDADRLPGSTRFMAPEEFRRGATIDGRTTVFDLGRTALVLLDRGPDQRVADPTSFRGTAAMFDVLVRATSAEPGERHMSVRELVADWRRAAEREKAP